jgi:lipid A 3-O-deacylase
MAAVALGACPPPASAETEARVGAAAHNVNGASSEGGAAIQLELVGDRLSAPRWLFAPRPYAMASANLDGDTSYAAAGLYWRVRISDRWSIEPGFGFAVHDGALRNPYPDGDPRADAFAQSHQLLGSRVLFRDSLGVRRSLENGRAVSLTFEHLSNGGSLFGHEDNQSLNELTLSYSVQLPL